MIDSALSATDRRESAESGVDPSRPAAKQVASDAGAARRMAAGDLDAVAAIFVAAFPDKTAAAVPGDPPSAARVFAEAALAGGDAWVRDDERGRALAVITFQGRKRPFLAHLDTSLLRRIRPLRRALRAMAFLTLFHAVDFPASELYLETLAVHPDAQGRGLGRALLDFADDEARRRGRSSLSLYCVRDNTRARALYVRHGYRLVRSEDLWWCGGLLGFRYTDQMRRALPAGS